jgi:hypothetical protein
VTNIVRVRSVARVVEIGVMGRAEGNR